MRIKKMSREAWLLPFFLLFLPSDIGLGLAHSIPGSSIPGTKRDLTSLALSYDYVIVGGGTSGLVLANRLSEDGDSTVLVVEYGDFERGDEVTVPFLTTQSQAARLYNVTSVPQRHLDGRVFDLRIGATVGGSSTVNGMAWDRGSAADYDAWEALGNPGWGWEGLLPYFRKSSRFVPPAREYVEKYGYNWTKEGAYGDDGGIHVTLPPWQWPAAAMQAAAWSDDLRVPVLADGVDGDNVGIAWLPQNSDAVNATRSTSTTAYYDPVSGRPNLHLLVRHYGARIIFEGTESKRASGVEIASRDDPGAKLVVGANKDVILAAGTVNTPRILQASGVGPSALLGPLGIDVVVDLPGVGANFQDHPSFFMIYNYVNDTTPNPENMQNPAFLKAAWETYRANRTGPLAHSWGNRIVFQALRDLTPRYESIAENVYQQGVLDYLPGVYAENPTTLAHGFLAQRKIIQDAFMNPKYGVLEITFGGATANLVALQKPLSRGTIVIDNSTGTTAASTDPNISPLVDFGSLTNPVDVAILVAGLKRAREFMAGPSVAGPLNPIELVPGPSVSGDDTVVEAALRSSMVRPSFDHPVGTAAMMPAELGGVVDSRDMHVYGVKGLRVVDASVMPLLPAAHTQATVYAVAEKAADLIRGRK